MKSGWSAKRLGDLSELITKGTTPTSVGHSFVPEGINFVKVESISENGQFIGSKLARITEDCHGVLRRSQLKSGDILFSIAGALGRTALVTDEVIPANTNQALAIIRLKKSDEVLPEFVLQALSTGIVLEQIEKFKGGVAQQNLSLAQVQDFQIVIPPLPEQKRIVGILDEAFEGIATATANAEKNLHNARALFESHLEAVFARRSDEVPLSKLASEITDGDHSPPPKASTGIPFITISDIVKRTREVDFSNTFTVPAEYFQKLKPNKKPRVGDILYTVTGATLGIPVLVKEQRDFCFQRHIGLVRPNPDTDSAWLTYALLSPQVFRQATTGSTGAAQKTVSLSVLRGLKVPKLALSQQKRIAAQLDFIAEETQRLESIYQQKLAALDELKKSLLHQAFSGAL